MKHFRKSATIRATKLLATIVLLPITSLADGVGFDKAIVRQIEGQMYEDLSTDPVALEWSNATDPIVKSGKFAALVAKAGGSALSGQWNYPGEPNWPLVNWAKVDTLNGFLDDQFSVLETVGVVATTDQDAAKLAAAGRLIKNAAKDMAPWFETWFLDLAKGGNVNEKRLALWSISGFAEDIKRNVGDSGPAPIVRWDLWQQAFSQADALGKALILTVLLDLATRMDSFDTARAIHESVFAGTDDGLKAFAVVHGSAKLGPTVISARDAIAASHSNLKLRSLAEQAKAPLQQ